MARLQAAVFVTLVLGSGLAAGAPVPPEGTAGCYRPVAGGWRIRIMGDPTAARLAPGRAIGVTVDDARQHRRPLYPPADRSLVWTRDELASRQRVPFRPMVLTANEPRLVVDLDTAGGLSGHWMAGLAVEGGPSKWFHQWDDLDVQYVEGRMEYVLRDAAFPGVVVRLRLTALDRCVGFLANVAVEGLSKEAFLVWAFGGASGFTTNYNHDAPEYRFAPSQCADNAVRWEANRFTLRRNGAAVLRGGSSWTGRVGFGDPSSVVGSPATVRASAHWCEEPQRREESNRVVVQEVRVGTMPTGGWIVVGRGGAIDDWIADPTAAETAARERNRAIAGRIKVHTPDPYLDQAMTLMAFSTDGLWGDAAILHGAWSWRQAYLGWRGWYGPLCYGWTDRVRLSIERHATLGAVRQGPNQGAVSHMLEDPGGVFYNMDEVFLDQVRAYFDYTGDLELMRRIFPVLQGVVEWENRRLQPGDASLYESSLDTWISDSHWYIRGQCTTASAYMLGAHRFLAELAARLGKDPEPYRKKAVAIREALQRRLWMPRRGVFAEYVDTLGHRQLHSEPELATIYHSAEFGAASPLQIQEMLHWVDTHLRAEATPGGGKAVWSSNWAPNHGRSYTHSTYELSYGEQCNLALIDDLAGRSDDAYALLVGGLCGIYNGPTPGGLSCHMYADGRQRANNEFADAISMWDRAVVEGLFGVHPKRADGVVELAPRFPAAWTEASIEAPHFGYTWKRDGTSISVVWKSPAVTEVRLRVPVAARSVTAFVNGEASPALVEPGVMGTLVEVRSKRGKEGTLRIAFDSLPVRAPAEIVCREGETLELRLSEHGARTLLDPQEILGGKATIDGVVRGKVSGEPGPHVMYLVAGSPECPRYLPVPVRIEPRTPVKPAVWSPPKTTPGDLSRWTLIDLSGQFNAPLTDVLPRVARATRPPVEPALGVNHAYWKDHITGRVAGQNPWDGAWRQKIGSDGVGWTHDRIPFKSPAQGDNLAVVTRAGGFPEVIDVPLHARGTELFLMLSGMTFPAQSQVVNLRITLAYADGSRQHVDLDNPTGIGDCWSNWCGRFHDTAANGFENLGGRFGPAGSASAGDLTRPVEVDTEAHLVRIPLRPGAELATLTLEAFANDVIYGLMGASILR